MDEYIKKATAIEWVDDLIDTMSVCTSIDECLGMKSMKSRALGALHDVPAADVVAVRHGKWIEENTRLRSSQFCCSVCHRTAYDPQPTRSVGWVKRCRYAYCPNCGAKMTEDHHEQKE